MRKAETKELCDFFFPRAAATKVLVEKKVRHVYLHLETCCSLERLFRTHNVMMSPLFWSTFFVLLKSPIELGMLS